MKAIDYHEAAERLKRIEREGDENKKKNPKEKFCSREGEIREVEIPSPPKVAVPCCL